MEAEMLFLLPQSDLKGLLAPVDFFGGYVYVDKVGQRVAEMTYI